MKAYLITWFLSVAAASIIGGTWIYTHPQPRLARVDMKALFSDQKAVFDKMLKPDMTQAEQQAVIAAAKNYSVHLNQALVTLSTECNCAILNSDAILEMPKNTSGTGIQNMTARARQLINMAQ
jgi:hypothetical protein